MPNTWDIEEELLEAGELLEPDVGVRLDEQNALTGAVDGQLAPLELPQSASKRVIVHERPRHGVPDNHGRVFAAHGLVVAVELDVGGVPPKTGLVVDVGEPLQFPRRRPCRYQQLRRLPSHREPQGRRGARQARRLSANARGQV